MSQSLAISPRVLTIIPFKKDIPVKISLSFIKKENNYCEQVLIWMNPSTQEIKLNMLQSYRWKYNCMVTDIVDKIYELTYSINKAEKDAILELSYNKNMKIDEDYFASNPFKIIHNNRNVTGITNYEIRKGETYKIIVCAFYKKLNTNPPTYMHYLPSFLFEFANVKGKEPEFGKEISFDINNNNTFKTTFSEDGSLFIRVDFNTSNLLDIIITSLDDNYNKTIEPPGLQTVIPFKKDKFIRIILKYKSNSDETGIIWMYPSTQEIKIDLKQTYEFKYDFKRTCGHQITSQMIYSIDNADYNA